MKKRTIFLVIILVLLVLLFLDRCVWNQTNAGPADFIAGQPALRASVDDLKAKFQRVIDAPLPSITFSPPPPPLPEPAPEPVVAPVVVSKPRSSPPPRPAAARTAAPQPKKTVPASRPQAAPMAPVRAAPRPEQRLVESGGYYVVRQKVERNGSYYLICSIMGDPTNRNFGYAVSAEQYQRAERGLVFDSKNMTGWRRVSRIE